MGGSSTQAFDEFVLSYIQTYFNLYAYKFIKGALYSLYKVSQNYN